MVSAPHLPHVGTPHRDRAPMQRFAASILDRRRASAGLAERLRPYELRWLEEPLFPEDLEGHIQIRKAVTWIPIATGERLYTKFPFAEIVERHAADVLQPDIANAGGITELKKVANMAEVYYMHILPHCAIGPVAFTASMHVDAVVPNFLIQEHIPQSLGGPFAGPPGRARNRPLSPIQEEGLLVEPWQVVNGHIELPTKPGLGIEINERVLKNDFVYEE